ncbi:MAG: tetratricopeptide repeat protein [Acidobacteria bacterium]|nr:tetratricopeptide repeat protein [Acidobacteriota bacterium]
MSSPHKRLPRRVLLAFALSGISALVYEVIWVRLLGDLFGHTAYAVQAVLAVFFGGLALGSFLSDRLRLDGRGLLKAYAAIEVVVGIAGLLFPLTVSLVTPFYDRLAPLEFETGAALLFRLAAALLLLVVPTALMGATLPLVIKWQTVRGGEQKSGVATLYAANTVGGALGAWASAFVLVPSLGVSYALAVAALGNFAAALLAVSLIRESAGSSADGGARGAADVDTPAAESFADETEPPAVEPTLTATRAAALLCATGFVAISLEVLWTRSLDQVLAGTVYSFATVLSVFLLGIALGSWMYRALIRPRSLLRVFAAAEVLLANYVIASLFLIYFTPGVSARLGQSLGLGFVRRGVILESLLSALILLAPAVCMGVIFPLLLDAARGRQRPAPVGLLVAANTVGSVLGPLVAGFFLLPRVGLRGSLLVMAALCLLLAAAAQLFGASRAKAWPVVAAGAAAAVVLFVLAPRDIRTWGVPGERLIDYREDPAASVSVVESGGAARERRLKVNNTYSLGGGRGVFTERRQGHLPMLLHPSPQRVLVLGVGTGNTLGAVALHGPRRLAAVELVPGVLELARKHFATTNYRVLDDPRVAVFTGDALRVARATPEKYDLVVADLFHPWQAGVGSLYSREHFAAVRRALDGGGVFCQWLPLYQLSEEDLKTVVRTFLAAFPEASAWLGNFGTGTPILALVGSNDPVQLRWKRWEDSLADGRLREALKAVYLDQPAEVLGGYVGGRAALERFAGAGPINSIGRPAVEFSAPGTLYAESFGPAKLRSLESLVNLDVGARAPVSFEGARRLPEEATNAANAESVRLMITALIENERGDKARALRTAVRSAQLARGYGVPAAILSELAWGVLAESPAAAEEGFREALRVRPDDPNALTGLGNAYLALRRPEEAAEAFRKALGARPDWSEAAEGLEQAKRIPRAMRDVPAGM